MTHDKTPIRLSLFRILTDELSDALPIVTYTKATLVHLSHTLEDIVLQERLPALLFTGFQKSSYWEQETARYNQLAQVAKQITIFAGELLPESTHATQLHITLEGDDPLRQEWFVAILSRQFAIVLCGQDNATPTFEEGLREFNTFWSFEPKVVNHVMDTLEDVIKTYRPDRLKALQKARQDIPPIAPDARLITRFTLEMLQFEEKLNGQLRREQEQFRQVVDAISHQIYVKHVDLDNAVHLLFLSPNIDRLTGYPVEKFEIDPHFWVSMVLADDIPASNRHMEKLIDGDDSEVEYRIRHRAGHIVWVRDNARVRYDPISGSKMIYGVMLDITDQREIESSIREYETLRLQLEKEREMSVAHTRFMTTVSHEFRTPLATIMSSTENIERYIDRMSSQDRNQRLRTIKEQVLHLRNMLDDISTLIKGEARLTGYQPVQVDLRWLSGDITESIAVATNNSHKITFNFEGEDRPVMADPRLVRHILNNLLNNAVKYSAPNSHITLDLELGQQQAIVRVTDEGIGIPPEDHEQVFNAFFRGGNVSNITGSGLGLKIVYDSVMLHGGSIRFTSVPMKGTTFVVMLPVEPV